MRNYLRIGDRVKLKDGSTVTIKSLDIGCFTCMELKGYQNKSQIDHVIEPPKK